MKKYIFVILGFVFILLLSSCANHEDTQPMETHTTPNNNSDNPVEETPPIDLAKTVPDPYTVFENLNFNYYDVSDTETDFCWMIDGDGVSNTTFESFRLACRGCGWDDAETDTDDLYVAHMVVGTDQYRLELVLSGEDTLNFSCGVYKLVG